MKSTIELKKVIELLSKNHAFKDLDNLLQTDIRHKSNATEKDYLNAFLTISRCFGYATNDDSWGEFEKEFHVIIMRLIKAEQMCQDNNLVII